MVEDSEVGMMMLRVQWYSIVVTAYDFESGRPGSNPERRSIYYKASITAQGLPEPSSLRGNTFGTRTVEYKGCNWGMQID